MWITPKTSGSHPWPLWSTQKESNWFLLTRNNAGLIVEKPYRIILKTNGNSGWLVAVGNETEIEKSWTYIQQNIEVSMKGSISADDTITYALSKFQSLALDENMKTLPSDAQSRHKSDSVIVDINMDEDIYDSRFYHESGDITAVERDLEDLAREDPSLTTNLLHSNNVVTSSTKIPPDFHIPSGEQVVALYSISMWATGIPRRGWLYVTPNFVCFHSPAILLLSDQYVTIYFNDIVHVQFFVQSGFEYVQVMVTGSGKESTTAEFSPDAGNFKTIAFVTLSGGSEIFNTVNELWKLSIKTLQSTAADQKRLREGESKEEYLVTYEEAMKLKQAMKTKTSGRQGNDEATKGKGTSDGNTNSTVASKVREALEKIRPQVLKEFRLPESEQVLTQARTTLTIYSKRGHSYVKSSSDTANIDGILFLTTHFIVFMDRHLFKSTVLGKKSSEFHKQNNVAFQKAENSTDAVDDGWDVADSSESTSMMEAEWDVAAVEDENSLNQTETGPAPALLAKQKQEERIRKLKKNIPSTSLATDAEAPTRIWLVVPLCEMVKLKIGKPPSTVSTAYSGFGITPDIVNIFLPYNMYAFTFINRPNMVACLTKVYTRVQAQVSRRPALRPYSLDLSSTSPPSSIVSSPSSSATNLVPSSNSQTATPSGSTSTNNQDPPPRHCFFAHLAQHPLNTSDVKFPSHVINDAHQFAGTYRARERLQEEKFLAYFQKYGCNVSFVRKGPELAVLVRNGIPHSLRGHLWFTLSGGSHRMMVSGRDYYSGLLESHGGKYSVAVEQIEKDLHRSMPSHPYFGLKPKMARGALLSDNPNAELDPLEPASTVNDTTKSFTNNYDQARPNNLPYSSLEQGNSPASPNVASTPSVTHERPMFEHPLHPPLGEPAGISALRRVLVAYSWHNPVIGYCQSMNIVVASLLLYMSEEEAFYTLITFVDYLEEYWTREMMGAIVDMHVLKDVLKMKKPHLVSHLESLSLDYSIIALPWFMCLFFGYVPMQLALRLMDCFCYNAGLGKASATLFQAAVALFCLAENQLQKCEDPVQVSDVLRKAPYECDFDQLISAVFMDDSLALRSSILNELRNFHRYTAIKNVENQNEEDDLMILLKGEKKLYKIPALSQPSSSSSSSPPSTSTHSEAVNPSFESISPSDPLHPLPPPATPVHSQLRDLKRFYLDFKQVLMTQSSNSSSILSESNSMKELVHIANTRSVASCLSESGFYTAFKSHISWWPYLEHKELMHQLFNWMDKSNTKSLSFVEYMQGLDVLMFANAQTISTLFFDLLASPSNGRSINWESFQVVVKCSYLTLLYSKADESTKQKEERANKPVLRKHLNVAAGDDLDDWLLVDIDEQYDNKIGKDLQNIFKAYADDGLHLLFEKFNIAFNNLLVQTPPQQLRM